MVTIYKLEKSDNLGTGKFLVKLRGLSLDDKPTTINGGTVENGSTFIEIDTGDEYMYDLENTTWYKIASGNGGSEPMEKFDYVIPAGLYDDVTGEITDTDIISVLEEISSNFLDADNNIKPLNIGVHIGNDEYGNEGFSVCYQIGIVNDKVNLQFFSYFDSFLKLSIGYYENKWTLAAF